MFKLLLDLIFPQTCLLCDTQGELICEICLREKIESDDSNICHVCGKFINKPGLVHSFCRGKTNLDGVICAVKYSEAAGKIVWELKYNFMKTIANFMIPMLIEKLELSELEYDAIIPIPLSRKRLWWRGFNQSEILARGITGKVIKCIARVRNTASQVGLNREQRLRNLKDSFVAESVPDLNTVVLIDDVFTTGATMEECAKVLKQAGVKCVFGLAWARD